MSLLFRLYFITRSSPPQRFEILALFMFTGIFSTLWVPETKGKSLEILSREDQEGFMGRASLFFFIPPSYSNLSISFSASRRDPGA